MANRLTRIYTRTGDDGTTGLGDGSRVAKDSLRVEALGNVDELNACIGRVRAHPLPAAVDSALDDVQHDLFEVGAELCLPGQTRISDATVVRLERLLERFNEELAPLREFILPGGTPAAADAHIARTVCRRAERSLVALGAVESTGDDARRYLNRLSDLLFVLARVINLTSGGGDVYWRPRKADTADPG